MPEQLPELNPDQPLYDPNLDRLGYAPFACHLADCVVRMTPADGIVLAVYGSWGSGKTTVLNFVQHFLEQYPEADRPTVVRFNPWWFTGQEQLTRQFFTELGANIDGAVGRELKSRLADVAELVSEIPLPYAKNANVLKKLLEKSVSAEKDLIEKELRKRAQKILIIIDDLDRLEIPEISQMLRLVKAVANFPNIIYLLAFDRKIVADALGGNNASRGDDYLEKIVQVPFELPVADKSSINRLFTDLLNDVVRDVPEEEFDQTYWGNVFVEGISPFLHTPRDVTRLINSLRVTYPAVHGEVNAIDMIAVETLRVFCPTVYDAVRRNETRFAGTSDRYLDSAQRTKEEQAFLQNLLEEVSTQDRKTVKNLLRRIFPRLLAIWDNYHYGNQFLAGWRRSRRVCSPEHFHVYFRLSLPEGAISNAEFRTAFAQTSNVEEFGHLLRDYASQKRPGGGSRVEPLLERLWDYAESDIADEHIGPIITSFFTTGDELWLADDPNPSMTGFGNSDRVGRLIRKLLVRLPKEQRCEVLMNAISLSGSVSTIGRQIGILDQEQGRFRDEPAASDEHEPEDQWLVSSKCLDRLEELALSKIRAAADDGSLLLAPRFRGNLYRWRNWAGAVEPRTWAASVVETDEGLAKFLEGFLRRVVSQSIDDSVSRISFRLPPSGLEEWVSVDQIADRARTLAISGAFSDEQRRAADTLVKEIDLLAEGKDPERYLE